MQKVIFSFVFKIMEYPQTRTQKLNFLNQEKMHFSATPSPSRGGGGFVETPPPSFWFNPPVKYKIVKRKKKQKALSYFANIFGWAIGSIGQSRCHQHHHQY